MSFPISTAWGFLFFHIAAACGLDTREKDQETTASAGMLDIHLLTSVILSTLCFCLLHCTFQIPTPQYILLGIPMASSTLCFLFASCPQGTKDAQGVP